MVVEEERLGAAGPDGPAGRPRLLVGRLCCSGAELLALGVLVTGALAVLGLLWALADRPGEVPAAPLAGLVTASPSAAAATELVVHVAGHVAVPGIHRLPPGSRVGDAVASAGGSLPGAGVDALNLARPLADGEQIVVPGPGATVASAPATETVTARRPDGRLDLNLADAADLDELPGVGPVLAERILAHRTAMGRFTSVDELRDVKGIGEATFAELAGEVTV